MKYTAFDLRCAWHMWIFLLSLCTWFSKLHCSIPVDISFLFLHLASDLFFSLMAVISHLRGRVHGEFGFRILKVMLVVDLARDMLSVGIPGWGRSWNKRNRIVECKREVLSACGRGAKAGWQWWWWWVWWGWWGVLGVGGGSAGEDGFIFHPCPFSFWFSLSAYIQVLCIPDCLFSHLLFPSLSL